MTTTTTPKAWDFSSVQRLINSLDTEQPAEDVRVTTPPSGPAASRSGIGDLGPVWALLDAQKSEAAPIFRELDRLTIPQWNSFPHSQGKKRQGARDDGWSSSVKPVPNNPLNVEQKQIMAFLQDAYASDGATQAEGRKAVSGESSDEEILFEVGEKFDFFADDSQLETRQEARSRKKERKQATLKPSTVRQAFSDGESAASKERPKMPAARAASHQVIPKKSFATEEPVSKRNPYLRLPAKSESAGKTAEDKDTAKYFIKSVGKSSKLPRNDTQESQNNNTSITTTPISKSKGVPRDRLAHLSASVPKKKATLQHQASVSDSEPQAERASKCSKHVATESGNNLAIPSTDIDKKVALGSRQRSKSASNLPAKQSHTSTTKLVDAWLRRDRVERDLAYRLTLIKIFPEDRLSLSQTVAFKQTTGPSIHVFIDFSNIWIGYMEYLKHLMGLPKYARLTPAQSNLSFESLVFLLERGRHAEKRVLAGSWPWLPAFNTANAIGYDSSILNKVQKNRDLTNEQRHFHFGDKGDYSSLQPPIIPKALVPSNVTPQRPTTATQQLLSSSPEKWVEQGVDELLQLKMSHSLLDYDTPSTIVLATGDGAQAEYSDGFAAMVERVLRRGWKVELVSWKHCTSSIYSRPSWLAKWPKGQFRYIALEPFAEYLLEGPQV